MYYQIEQVLEKYGLERASAYKGRQVLVCESDSGLWALKEFNGSPEKADFLYRFGVYMAQAGFLMDGLVKTKEGELWAEGVDGVNYTLHHWYKGKECDVKNRMDIMMAVSHLAKLHQISRGFMPEPGEQIHWREEPVNEYERHNRELCQIRNFIQKRKKKNDFERLFLNCFSEFYGQCKETGTALADRNMTGSGTRGICHGDFNQHNILFRSGEPAVIHFEKVRYGIQIFDLCNFMRKILEKYNWDEALGMAMVEEYDRVCPMKREDLIHLYYRMAYPEKFWKLANHYYASRKVWISRQNLEKLQKEIRQNTSRCRYLKKLHRLLDE